MPTDEALSRKLEPWRQHPGTPLVLEVLFEHGTRNALPALLERWSVTLNSDALVLERVASGTLYKHAVLLFRALYARLLLLPAHGVRKQLRKLKLSPSRITYRVHERPTPGVEFLGAHRSLRFLDVATGSGSYRVDVEYLADVSALQPALPPEGQTFIANYDPRGNVAHSPTDRQPALHRSPLAASTSPLAAHSAQPHDLYYEQHEQHYQQQQQQQQHYQQHQYHRQSSSPPPMSGARRIPSHGELAEDRGPQHAFSAPVAISPAQREWHARHQQQQQQQHHHHQPQQQQYHHHNHHQQQQQQQQQQGFHSPRSGRLASMSPHANDTFLVGSYTYSASPQLSPRSPPFSSPPSGELPSAFGGGIGGGAAGSVGSSGLASSSYGGRARSGSGAPEPSAHTLRVSLAPQHVSRGFERQASWASGEPADAERSDESASESSGAPANSEDELFEDELDALQLLTSSASPFGNPAVAAAPSSAFSAGSPRVAGIGSDNAFESSDAAIERFAARCATLPRLSLFAEPQQHAHFDRASRLRFHAQAFDFLSEWVQTLDD